MNESRKILENKPIIARQDVCRSGVFHARDSAEPGPFGRPLYTVNDFSFVAVALITRGDYLEYGSLLALAVVGSRLGTFVLGAGAYLLPSKVMRGTSAGHWVSQILYSAD